LAHGVADGEEEARTWKNQKKQEKKQHQVLLPEEEALLKFFVKGQNGPFIKIAGCT